MMDSEPQQRIWQVVSLIPPGRVASYGQVARLSGIGRGARLVGHILKQLPEGSTIPWHRVVNAQGRLSLPVGSPAFREQKRRLISEGVELSGNKICSRYFIQE